MVMNITRFELRNLKLYRSRMLLSPVFVNPQLIGEALEIHGHLHNSIVFMFTEI